MNIHIIVSLTTLFFGFGYAYGDSRKLSFIKILMTLMVVAPFIFQIYQSYSLIYFILTAASLGAGFIFGWNKGIPTGDWLFSLRRAMAMPNFRNNFASEGQKSTEKPRNRAKNQEDFERERKRRADEMKRKRERERDQRAGEDNDKNEKGSQQQRKKSSNSQKKPPDPKPPVKPPAPEPKDRRTPEEILGLKPGWTKQDLRSAYIREMKRWHSDSMMDKPEALRKVAEEEAKKVNTANETLKRRV